MKILRIFPILLMVTVLLGGCGWITGESTTQKQIKIAENLLKEKYNEDFEVVTIGERWGTLTNNTFTVRCIPVDNPEYIFKAEIEKSGAYMFDSYVSTIVCKKLQKQLEGIIDNDNVSVFISSRPSFIVEDSSKDISVSDFVKENDADFVIYLVTTESYEQIRESIDKFISENPDISGVVRYYENVSEEQLEQFKKDLKGATEFTHDMDKDFDGLLKDVAF